MTTVWMSSSVARRPPATRRVMMTCLQISAGRARLGRCLPFRWPPDRIQTRFSNRHEALLVFFFRLAEAGGFEALNQRPKLKGQQAVGGAQTTHEAAKASAPMSTAFGLL